MPIYEYRCGACGSKHEALQKLSDAPLTQCPACGEPAMTKLVSAAGFQLKGSGWYVTDFKNGSKGAAKAGDKVESKTGDKDESKSKGDKPESKSQGEKSETKSGDDKGGAKPKEDSKPKEDAKPGTKRNASADTASS